MLKGNKDLCSNVEGLQLCRYGQGVNQQLVRKSHKVVFIIIFPLLGALVLLFAFIRIFLIAERRGEFLKSKTVMYKMISFQYQILMEEQCMKRS